MIQPFVEKTEKPLWSFAKAAQLFALPFNDLLYQAHAILRQHFNPNKLQISTLLNIKSGGCSENCTYCAQSMHHQNESSSQSKNLNISINQNKNHSDSKKVPMMNLQAVIAAARSAKSIGIGRLCMAAAWRGPDDRGLDIVCEMIRAVKQEGVEACVSLGLLTREQALKLKTAGLDYYNHNIDTSPTHYPQLVTTHGFEDRLRTLEHVREAGIKICCGGILGVGETNDDRIKMLVILANLPTPPESVPINQLIPIPGTPLEHAPAVDPFDFVRTIALARIMMSKSYVRLSAGRSNMSDELQALCFFAGANSIFYGDKLLTTLNPSPEKDGQLLLRLGLSQL